MELNFFGSFSGWLCLSTSRLVPGVGWRSPTTPLRRTAWRGVCLPPPPSPPPRSGTGPPAAITCSTSASLSDLYLIINLMALETICIEKSIYVFQFKLSCIIQPVSKWCFLNGLNDHNQVWEEDRPWETVAVDIWRNTSQKLPCSLAPDLDNYCNKHHLSANSATCFEYMTKNDIYVYFTHCLQICTHHRTIRAYTLGTALFGMSNFVQIISSSNCWREFCANCWRPTFCLWRSL